MEPIPILTGPTAVGKTALSLELARVLDAEIVSADSRQVYRELNVGTAKPSASEQSLVRHHFINERSLGEDYSAGLFHSAAYERIADIHSRRRNALVVGGSTLYVHALQHGLADIPDVPSEVRSELRRRLHAEGADALYDELAEIDPVAADSMDPTKTQRLLRALEVHASTGRSLTSFHEEQKPPPFSFRTVVLSRDRRQLYNRINERAEAMLDDGLLDEVKHLIEAGHDLSVNPLRTIGYQEPISYLRDEITYEEMVRLIKRNTRRYAKRQLTWFRRDSENVWVQADTDMPSLLQRLVSLFTRAQHGESAS